MPAGAYRMDFETAAYMARCHAQHPAFFAPHPFYPRVHVHFQIAPGQVCAASAVKRSMLAFPNPKSNPKRDAARKLSRNGTL